MPLPHEWPSRLKAVEREFQAAWQAVRYFRNAAQVDANILEDSLRVRDIDAAMNHLEETYFIRLFAEFETGARRYWASQSETHPKTEDLLNGIGARRRVATLVLEDAHLVREYRNALVHERDEVLEPISVPEARGTLCKFLGFLPSR